MSALDAAQRYFDAWNRRDPDAIVASLTADGTYLDPNLPAPLGGPALAGYATSLFTGFPDASFEIGDHFESQNGVTAEWVMRATNSGPFGGAPPTGATVELPGIDVIAVENDRVRSVRGYFDRRGFLEQLGLQVVVQPVAMGPVRFGTSVYMQLGKPTRPAAVSLTWIDARDAGEAGQVEAVTRDEVLPELAAMPGFLSTLLARAGDRLFTVSAWEDGEAPRQLMSSDGHRAAMRHFFQKNLGTAVHTAVWTVHHSNPLWVRCPGCEQVRDYDAGEGLCGCGHPLPQVPLW